MNLDPRGLYESRSRERVRHRAELRRRRGAAGLLRRRAPARGGPGEAPPARGPKSIVCARLRVPRHGAPHGDGGRDGRRVLCRACGAESDARRCPQFFARDLRVASQFEGRISFVFCALLRLCRERFDHVRLDPRSGVPWACVGLASRDGERAARERARHRERVRDVKRSRVFVECAERTRREVRRGVRVLTLFKSFVRRVRAALGDDEDAAEEGGHADDDARDLPV